MGNTVTGNVLTDADKFPLKCSDLIETKPNTRLLFSNCLIQSLTFSLVKPFIFITMKYGQVVHHKSLNQLGIIKKKFESGVYVLDMVCGPEYVELLATEKELTHVPGITVG